jgi:hypothetical protein
MACLSGEFVRGFDANGTLVCESADSGGPTEIIGPQLPPPTVDGCETATNTEEKFVCGINEIRLEAPNANPSLPQVIWSPTIAAIAQAGADTCSSPGLLGSYGQSWYARFDTNNVEFGAIELWASSRQIFNEVQGYCLLEQHECADYTFMVSRNVTEIGCGVALNCPGSLPAKAVCLYSPMPQGVSGPPY